MKQVILSIVVFVSTIISFGQNVGVNTTTPQATLDVNGTTKTNNLTIATGGNQSDFLVKSTSAGQIGHRKGHTAQAIRFIICLAGIFPSPDIPYASSGEPFVGEIKMCALANPNLLPVGWAFCDGQILLISSNTALYSLIGTNYGGDGITTFALPDFRGTAILGAGNGWALGEKSN